jgi:hypothetical protein
VDPNNLVAREAAKVIFIVTRIAARGPVSFTLRRPVTKIAIEVIKAATEVAKGAVSVVHN